MENTVKIDLSKAVVTPLERWIDVPIELDAETVTRLQRLAEQVNQSMDNVVNHILGDTLAAHVEMTNVSADALFAAAKESPLILLLQDGKTVARVEMIDKGKSITVAENEMMPPQVDSAGAEAVAQEKCVHAIEKHKSA